MDTITSDIPTLFHNLITSYGQLTPTQLDERETNVKATTYDPAFNIISVFNIIQRFQDLCTLLKTPKTDSQLVQIRYIIISHCPLFKHSLREWNKKLPEEKTYINFKDFMVEQYKLLKAADGLTIRDSNITSANSLQEIKDHQALLTQQMGEELKANVREIFQAFQMT